MTAVLIEPALVREGAAVKTASNASAAKAVKRTIRMIGCLKLFSPQIDGLMKLPGRRNAFCDDCTATQYLYSIDAKTVPDGINFWPRVPRVTRIPSACGPRTRRPKWIPD